MPKFMEESYAASISFFQMLKSATEFIDEKQKAKMWRAETMKQAFFSSGKGYEKCISMGVKLNDKLHGRNLSLRSGIDH